MPTPMEPPSQSHSDTSIAAAAALPRHRAQGQERWVYERLRRVPSGLADWQLWDLVQPFGIFDQKSSLHRARVGLVWVSRKVGATPWHPVMDSGRRITDPVTARKTTVWQLKAKYLPMPYPQWAQFYRRLARGEISPDDIV